MALPYPIFNPSEPIPNNPFYAPLIAELSSASGTYLVVGDGLIIQNGTISSAGEASFPEILAGPGIYVQKGVGTVTVGNTGALSVSAGAGISVINAGGTYIVSNLNPTPPTIVGTVTSVTAGFGLTGGTITSSGTIALEPVSTIAPATYPNATVTVDGYGRVTCASPGTPGPAFTATAPLSVTSSFPQALSISNASTTTKGAVQLCDAVNSASTTLAATARSVCQVSGVANSALSCAGLAFSQATAANTVATTAINNANAACQLANTAVQTANTAETQASIAGQAATAATQTADTALANAATAQSTANSALAGLDAKINKSTFTDKGQLLAGIGAGGFTALPRGASGTYLSINLSCPTGMEWRNLPVAGTVTCVAAGVGLTGGPITSTGTLSLASTGVTAGTYSTNVALTVDPQGRITTISNGPAPVLGCWFQKKGDLVTAVAPGSASILSTTTDGFYLRANSSAPLGIEWAASTEANIPCAALTGKGALITATAPGVPTALPLGTEGQVLTVCSAFSCGLTWKTPTTGTVTSITAGNGLSGGTITNSGTIEVVDSGVTAGSYCYASFQVNSKGQITQATNNPIPSTSVIAPLTNSGTNLNPVIGIAIATETNIGVVKVGSNISVDANGTISVATASALQAGVTKLNNTLTSACSTEALTAAQGCVLNTKIDQVDAKGGLVLAGTYNPINSLMITVTAAGAAAGFSVGAQIPLVSASIRDYFVISTRDASAWVAPGAAAPASVLQGDWIYSSGTAWGVVAAGAVLEQATTTTAGITRFATTAETVNGNDNTIAITPAGARDAYIPKSIVGADGALIVGQTGGAPTALPVGGDGAVLVACSTDPLGLVWDTGYLSNLCFTGKGYILAGRAPSQGVALQPGNEGDMLVVCGTAESGLAWVPPAATPYVPLSALGAKGSLIVGSAAGVAENLPIGTSGQFLTAEPTAACGMIWKTYCNTAIPCNYLVSKGTLVTTDGNVNIPYSLVRGSDGQVLTACDACAGGLVWQSLAQVDAIPASTFTQKAQIISSTGSNAFVALDVPASDGLVLKSQSTCPAGMAWLPDETGDDIPCSTITGIGQILVGNASAQVCALPKGSDGQILVVCDDHPNGLGVTWATTPPNPYIPCSLIQTSGDLIVGIGLNTPGKISQGQDGQILKVCKSCTGTYGYTWAEDNAGNDISCDIITQKGDLIAGNGTALPVRVPVGATGYVLKADPSATGGIAWAPENTGCGVCCSSLTGTGDLITSSAPGTAYILPRGAEGTFLKVCAACTTTGGLVWAPDNTGDDIPLSSFTQKGSLLVGAAAGVVAEITTSVADDGKVLTACSACTTGFAFTEVSGGGGGVQATPTTLGTVYGGNYGSNTALGYNAMPGIELAGRTESVAIGVDALCSNNTLSKAVVIGACAASSTSLMCNTVAIGSCAAKDAPDSVNSVLIGQGAGNRPGASCYSVAIGSDALGGSRTVALQYNVAVGSAAAYNISGSGNTALGTGALGSGNFYSGGSNNVAIGTCALGCQAAGDNNIGLGYFSGTSGSLLINSQSNLVNIGNNSTQGIRGVVGFTCLGDIRHKNVIGAVPLSLDFITSLNPIAFQFCDPDTNQLLSPLVHYGFSAQEMVQLEVDSQNPVIVSHPEETGGNLTEHPYFLDANELIPVLVNSIKELKAELDALKAQVNP